MEIKREQVLKVLPQEIHLQELLQKFWDTPDKLPLLISLLRGQIALAKGQIDCGYFPILDAHIKFQKKNGKISTGQFTRVAARCRLAVWSDNPSEAELILGDRVYLGVGTQIHAASKIKIGDQSMIARECDIMDTDFHRIIDELRHPSQSQTQPVVIGEHVWVGLKTIILKGVQIGNDSVIGAGSVVTSNIPTSCLAAGNPAKVIRKIRGWSI